MIVIIGASGRVGIPTIRHLVTRGARIRALTSSAASAARLGALGVHETVVGDFRNDADLRRAVDGADAVLHVPPAFTEDAAAIGLHVVAAARAAGVGHFVFSSAFHPQMRKMDHHWSKLVVEEAVIESGMPFTILQPSRFMQNIENDWPSIRDRGVWREPFSLERSMSLVDTEDLGEAAALVLTGRRFQGGTYELCGPESLTRAEMAAILSEEWGRRVTAEPREEVEWAESARARGWKPWAIDAYLKMCRHYEEHGYPGGNPLVLAAILGRAPTGFRAFVRRFLAEKRA